jgi:predicted RNase H-like nuclease (RuvC/YqgF family)
MGCYKHESYTNGCFRCFWHMKGITLSQLEKLGLDWNIDSHLDNLKKDALCAEESRYQIDYLSKEITKLNAEIERLNCMIKKSQEENVSLKRTISILELSKENLKLLLAHSQAACNDECPWCAINENRKLIKQLDNLASLGDRFGDQLVLLRKENSELKKENQRLQKEHYNLRVELGNSDQYNVQQQRQHKKEVVFLNSKIQELEKKPSEKDACHNCRGQGFTQFPTVLGIMGSTCACRIY